MYNKQFLFSSIFFSKSWNRALHRKVNKHNYFKEIILKSKKNFQRQEKIIILTNKKWIIFYILRNQNMCLQCVLSKWVPVTKTIQSQSVQFFMFINETELERYY